MIFPWWSAPRNFSLTVLGFVAKGKEKLDVNDQLKQFSFASVSTISSESAAFLISEVKSIDGLWEQDSRAW